MANHDSWTFQVPNLENALHQPIQFLTPASKNLLLWGVKKLNICFQGVICIYFLGIDWQFWWENWTNCYDDYRIITSIIPISKYLCRKWKQILACSHGQDIEIKGFTYFLRLDSLHNHYTCKNSLNIYSYNRCEKVHLYTQSIGQYSGFVIVPSSARTKLIIDFIQSYNF